MRSLLCIDPSDGGAMSVVVGTSVQIYPHPQSMTGGPLTSTQVGLPGLGYNFKWQPVFFNQSQKALSGASIEPSDG